MLVGKAWFQSVRCGEELISAVIELQVIQKATKMLLSYWREKEFFFLKSKCNVLTD